jgi:hypothetical protein
MFKVTRIDEGTYPAQFRTYAIGTYADFWTAYNWAHGEAKARAASNNCGITSTCYDADGVATFVVEYQSTTIGGRGRSNEVYSTITVEQA